MKHLTLFIVLFPAIVFSQSLSNYGRTNSDTLPEKFQLNAIALRDHIYKGIPNSYKKDQFERRCYRFAHDNSYFISSLISSGEVYSDWPALEEYMNDILKKIMPDELKKDTVIHAYIIQDGTYNAFMTPSGHTFIHIGLLADVSDEATVAGILAHELAHYYLKHSLYTFLKEEAGNFDNGPLFTNKASSKYSIKNELQADSLAMVWLYNSGYSIDGLISSFETMNRLERNRLKQSKIDWQLKETTHPLSTKRLQQIRDFAAAQKTNSGKNFLIDETKFFKFKEEAKPEILKYLLNNLDYYDCTEKAFRFHLFDPDNTTYIYYIMESIRRNCYLNIDIWKKLFITNRYYDSVMVGDNRHKEEMVDHLFKKFDFDILTINPKEVVKVKARFYWKDQPRFTTYEQAFNFFYKVSQALNCHECVLTNALSYTKDKEARKKLLEQYISYDNIKHREYSQNLLNGTILKNLPKQKIVAFNEFTVYSKQWREDIPIFLNSNNKTNDYLGIIDSIMENQKDRTSIFLPNFKVNHLNDYKLLKELEQFSNDLTFSKGERAELHILDPRYWEVLHKFKVNEIEFISSYYTEMRGKETTTEAYIKIINTDYNSIFTSNKYTRYLDIVITSVREIEDGVMKIRHYNGENKLTNEINQKQIIALTKYELSIKETRAIEIDKNNKYNLKHY